MTPSRRDILATTACGFGALALAGLLADETSGAVRATDPLAAKPPHFAAKAKHVIWLYQSGGWDPLESTCRHASLSIL